MMPLKSHAGALLLIHAALLLLNVVHSSSSPPTISDLSSIPPEESLPRAILALISAGDSVGAARAVSAAARLDPAGWRRVSTHGRNMLRPEQVLGEGTCGTRSHTSTHHRAPSPDHPASFCCPCLFLSFSLSFTHLPPPTPQLLHARIHPILWAWYPSLSSSSILLLFLYSTPCPPLLPAAIITAASEPDFECLLG